MRPCPRGRFANSPPDARTRSQRGRARSGRRSIFLPIEELAAPGEAVHRRTIVLGERAVGACSRTMMYFKESTASLVGRCIPTTSAGSLKSYKGLLANRIFLSLRLALITPPPVASLTRFERKYPKRQHQKPMRIASILPFLAALSLGAFSGLAQDQIKVGEFASMTGAAQLRAIFP